MGKNKEIGHKGESVAVDYLLSRGYSIRKTNYRFGRNEIDIICQTGRTLVFVEVKTRRSAAYGQPEDSIDRKKTASILRCAEHYIEKTGWQGNVRFDIISLRMGPDTEINHIEDAFY